ncbi:MAG: hypothetical protein KDI36_16405 [Pseudomonadales bacterium]|nr:hypothetical protein [Pseudomonadales bacterium]
MMAMAIGTAMSSGLAISAPAFADSNPFGASELSSGYMQVAEASCGAKTDAEGKCGEGKCGEGKCGAKADGKKAMGEGKCGEGKCGEGKCGSAA